MICNIKINYFCSVAYSERINIQLWRNDTLINEDINLGTNLAIVGGTGITTAATANQIQINLSGIPNSALDNSAVTIGSTAVNLGTTLNTTANLALTGTSSLSGTGTIDLTGAGLFDG